MKCFCCGVVELVCEMCNLFYIYKGQSIFIEVVMGDFCLVCGEVLFDCEYGDCYSV